MRKFIFTILLLISTVSIYGQKTFKREGKKIYQVRRVGSTDSVKTEFTYTTLENITYPIYIRSTKNGKKAYIFKKSNKTKKCYRQYLDKITELFIKEGIIKKEK